jgi:hypothetical protein
VTIRPCPRGAKAMAHDQDMFYTMIEVRGQEPKWLISLAAPKLRMLTSTTLNASRMPELEGPVTAKVGSGSDHRVSETVSAIHRLVDRQSRIGERKDRIVPTGEPDAR